MNTALPALTGNSRASRSSSRRRRAHNKLPLAHAGAIPASRQAETRPRRRSCPPMGSVPWKTGCASEAGRAPDRPTPLVARSPRRARTARLDLKLGSSAASQIHRASARIVARPAKRAAIPTLRLANLFTVHLLPYSTRNPRSANHCRGERATMGRTIVAFNRIRDGPVLVRRTPQGGALTALGALLRGQTTLRNQVVSSRGPGIVCVVRRPETLRGRSTP